MDIIPLLAKVTPEERDEVIAATWILRGLLFIALLAGYIGARRLVQHVWRTLRQDRLHHSHESDLQ